MRLVTWNCNMALPRKWDALRALKPDLAVIQECAAPDRLAAGIADLGPGRCLWTGDKPTKGLGLFAFGDWRLDPFGPPPLGADYFLPARVSGPVDVSLLGVWATYRTADKLKCSTGPTNRALDQLSERMAGRGDLIVAGDFNNNVRWDKPGWGFNHAALHARLGGLGLTSAYHGARGVAPGEEAEPTLYWRDRTADGPRYHIDYVFTPTAIPTTAQRITVGAHADWVAPGLSDHVPMILDIDDEALRRARDGMEKAA